MKYMDRNFLIGALLSFIITFLLFWQFFFMGLHPFPGNYLLGWYEPWKTQHISGNTITIAHKAIADDTFRYLYPFKVLGMDVLQKGELPLWNPFNGSGMPLLATLQWGFFNPFNIFFFFLPGYSAWTIYIIMQVFFLSLFTYLYSRKIGMEIKGAIFATLIFVLSGFVVVRLIFGNIVYPFIALPLVFYLIEIFFENSRSKKIFLIPPTIAFSIISGHPHMTFYVIIFSFFYFIYKLLTIDIEKKTIKTAFFAVLALLGIGFAGIQIIPAVELLTHANINSVSSQFIFNRFLLPVSHLVSILIPNYFGNQATYNYWGAGDYIETVAAVGIIPCFFAYLASFALPIKRKSIFIFYKIAIVLTILSTLNWFIPKMLSTLPIPIISTGPPSRIFVLTTFSLAILAGHGFDSLLSLKEVSKRIYFRLSIFIIAMFVLFLGTLFLYFTNVSCHNQFVPNCRLIALRNTTLEIFAFSIVLGLLFLFFFFRKFFKKQYIAFAIIFVFFLVGFYNSNKFLPFSHKETILPVNPLIKAIKEKTTDARVFGFGEANIKTNFATYFKFYDPNYYDPLYNKRYGELVSYANTGSFIDVLSRSDVEIVKEATVSSALKQRRDRLFSLLGVKYLIFKHEEVPLPTNEADMVWKDRTWYILKNGDVLPRTYLTSSYEVINNPNKILERLFSESFDIKKAVILEEQPFSFQNSKNESLGAAVIKEYQGNKVIIETNTQSNQILILTDNYFPGWKAFIDEKETKILRANYTFRAIVLPYGKHIVTFLYQPSSLQIGLFISVFSLFIYFLTILFYRKLIL